MLSSRDLVTEACMPSHPARLLSSLAPQAKLKELVASVASSKILHNKREIDVKFLGGVVQMLVANPADEVAFKLQAAWHTRGVGRKDGLKPMPHEVWIMGDLSA
jgi:hypothetical protein